MKKSETVKKILSERVTLAGFIQWWLVSIMIVLLMIGHWIGMLHWVLLGAIVGAIGHAISEWCFDSFLSPKDPIWYPMYSTGMSTGIFLTIGLTLLVVCEWWVNSINIHYLVMGVFAVEIANLIDLIHVWIILKGEEREK